MISVKKNMYVLKQSDGTIWNFKYDRNKGIIYKNYKNGIWSKYNIFVKEAKENFSAAILPNDTICIVYEDLNGNLMMYTFNGVNWKVYNITKNNNMNIFNVYFKIILYKNYLFLFYSIYKNSNKITIVFQTVDEKGNLSSIKTIDDIYFKYDIPFYINISNKNVLYIMYQKYENNHELGYKILNNDLETLSKFYVIDISLFSFKEYYLLAVDDTLHFIYIKKNKRDVYSLIYCQGSFSKYKCNNILESEDITSCSFFIINNHIWCLWIQNNEICSTFSIDEGEIFSIPPQIEFLNATNVFKAVYLSNYIESETNIYINDIFVLDENIPKCLVVDDIGGNIYGNNKNSKYLFYNKYLLNIINEKDYEKYIKKMDNIILKLKDIIKDNEIKLQYYEDKFKVINSSIANFNERKKELIESVNFFQNTIIDKEKRLNELENLYKEKEEEIKLLKEELEKKI